MTFPELAPNVWRSERPYIVTLVDGDRIPAYPVVGKVEDERFYFGDACKEMMWMVVDHLIESTLITECGQTRVLALDKVVEWEPLAPVEKAKQAS